MGIFTRARNKVRLFVNQACYDYKNSEDLSGFDFHALKHLLICKMDGKLGDSQVISPLIENLQKQCPNLQISSLCQKNIAPIYSEIYKIKVLEVKAKPSPSEIKAALEGLKGLPPPDVALTTEPYFRQRDFVPLAIFRPPYVAGIREGIACLNINLLERNYGSHISAYFEDFMRLGRVEPEITAYKPLLSKDAVKAMAPYANDHPVALAPFGASVRRRLKDETIVGIAKLLKRMHQDPLLILVPTEGRYLHDLVKKSVPGIAVCEYPQKINALELAALIDKCRAMISVDTANVHLSCASGLPLFAIYSGLDLEGITRWGPHPKFDKAEVFYKENAAIDEILLCDLEKPLANFLDLSRINGDRGSRVD